MTVAELISILSECDPHAVVMSSDRDRYYIINNVDICSDADFNPIVNIRE